MNAALTRIIVATHERGYSEDFFLQEDDFFVCIQTNKEYLPGSVNLSLLSQVKDEISKSYKYFYCLETPTGCRGVLLSDKLIFK